MQTHILVFPSIGKKRELKQALESFWRGNLSAESLLETSNELKKRHWQVQRRRSGLCDHWRLLPV